MLLWINGAFGVGKTATATRLLEKAPQWRLFDPEWVGYMLRANLPGIAPDDFQDLPAWRRLVPVVADEIADLTGDDLLVVQTVLREPYWSEICDGLEQRGHPVFHVLLDVESEALRSRIEHDTVDRAAAAWRLQHVDAFRAARPWLRRRADLTIDVTRRSADDAALVIFESLKQ